MVKKRISKLAKLWNATTSRIVRFIQGTLVGIGTIASIGVALPVGQLPPKIVTLCQWGMCAFIVATGLGFTKKKEDPNQLPPK